MDPGELKTKLDATRFVLSVLRSPLALMSIPVREQCLELARKFEISAEDLILLGVDRAKKS